MSDLNKPEHTMKWTSLAIVVCCAVPMAAALFLGGGLGILFGRTTRPTSPNQSISQTVNLSPARSELSANATSYPAANWW
jgi:hypothetical protein